MSGYHFLFVPGPSNVPAAVQQAIHCPMEDHRNPTIPDLIQPITQDLKKFSGLIQVRLYFPVLWNRMLGSCSPEYSKCR